MTDGPSDELLAAMTRHGIELPDDQTDKVRQYCQELWQWNAKLNLTRHTDYERFVARDLIDSRAIADHLQSGENILDVGTGGGVPGVVLAILCDDLNVSLCESVAKKARAVGQIVATLGLDVPVHHARAEDLLKQHRYDTLVIRAVARLSKLLQWFRPHRAAFGRILVLKGPSWIDERAEARHRGLLHDLALRKLAAYPLPGTNSESVLLQIGPADKKGSELSSAAEK